MIKNNLETKNFGSAYISNSKFDRIWLTKNKWDKYSSDWDKNEKQEDLSLQESKGNKVTSNISIEGFVKV